MPSSIQISPPTPPLVGDKGELADFDWLQATCRSSTRSPAPPHALHRIFTEESDIWHEIMLYAWIPDTLRLRQTCRHFQSLTQTRVLWCRFLRMFCNMHGIPPATYDLGRLSSIEIEAAVTRPYKFERRLSQDDGVRTFESSSLTLDTSFSTPAPGLELSLDDVVETTALVRGGRYLIAVQNRHFLSCWDLWAHDGSKAKVCPSVGIWNCPGRVLRILVQQSADDDNKLILAVYSQGESDDQPVPPENLIILSLNLGSDTENEPAGFSMITSTQLNVSNRACWTLDGDYVLVAGVLGAIAIWNWANDTWAVSKLSLAENDGSLTGEELRAVRYPRVAMVGPDTFAVNYATDHGLGCHFLKLPTFHPTLVEAIGNAAFTQVSRIGLSHNYLVGVFLPSWRAISRGKENALVQMLIWNDLRPECIGRYISLVFTEPAEPAPSTFRRVREVAGPVASTSTSASASVIAVEATTSQVTIPPPAPTSHNDGSSLHSLGGTAGDIKMHQGPFVALPRPGLFDETASGRLACIGCEGGVARSQIIDGPDGKGILPRVELGRCPDIKEFSYMDCWSGVLGVADLVDGGITLKTYLF